MDYLEYRKAFFIDPRPKPRFQFKGTFGVSLYFEDFDAAVQYYSQVLGPPAYVEGEGTRGWQIGSGWLTLFKSRSGNPQNIDLTFYMATPSEAEQLQRAFITAGGEGTAPSDELMYEPLRFCTVRDPFGTELLIVSPLASK